MFTRALCIATLAIALGTAFAATGASAQNPSPANRLALVVGEAAYSGDALPTAAADAARLPFYIGEGNSVNGGGVHRRGSA